MQENNAIAVVDLDLSVVKAIYPLPAKDWTKSGLDASDMDGGKLHYKYICNLDVCVCARL